MKLHCFITCYDRTLLYKTSRQKSILVFAKKSAECLNPYIYWQIIGKQKVEKYEVRYITFIIIISTISAIF